MNKIVFWIKSNWFYILLCAIIVVLITLTIIDLKKNQEECDKNKLILSGTLDKNGIDNIDEETNQSYRNIYVFDEHNSYTYGTYTLPKGFYCGCDERLPK